MKSTTSNGRSIKDCYQMLPEVGTKAEHFFWHCKLEAGGHCKEPVLTVSFKI
jgi:hypothetical protein